jgi:hypothetical protein
MRKRAVVLLGAGAPLAWGGPLTSQITNEILQNRDFRTKKGQNLAVYIVDQLATFYNRDRSEFTFEHIVNALETVVDYLSDDLKGSPPEFMGSKPLWFNLTDIYAEFENYRFTEHEGTDQGFLKNLAADPTNTPIQINSKLHKRYFIMDIVDNYLNLIRGIISNYDFSCLDKKHDGLNQNLWQFYKCLKDQGYIVRFYTTNYDELVPKIFREKYNHDLYSGFDIPLSKIEPEKLLSNPTKILLDNSVDCYYNLHGSLYWDTATDERRFEPAYVYCRGWANSYESGARSVVTNPSESTIIYNIVTGFNKLQKISVEPLNSFFHALAMDCIQTDILITIGYSYSDPHINRLLKHSVVENNAKLLHITKTDYFPGSVDFRNMQHVSITKKHKDSFEKVNKSWEVSNDRQTYIYTSGLEDFLDGKEWRLFLGY